MKKILITLLFVFSSLSVRAENCPTKPSCIELGYTYTQNDCGETKALKCPLDKNKLFCPKTKGAPSYTGRDCFVGEKFSINHRKCTTEKDAPSDYIFIENIQQNSTLMAVTLYQKEDSLQKGTFNQAVALSAQTNDRAISQAQLQKILRYFLLHYEYRCVITKEGLVYIDEIAGTLKDIKSEEDFKSCINEKTAPLGNYYDLQIARFNYALK